MRAGWTMASADHATMLMNETYTGRTVHYRTQRVKITSARTQKRKKRGVERPESDWIEVEDATPLIVLPSTPGKAGRGDHRRPRTHQQALGGAGTTWAAGGPGVASASPP